MTGKAEDILDMSLRIANSILQPHLSGDSELTSLVMLQRAGR